MVREETFFPLIPIVVAERDNDDALLESFLQFVNSNDYGLRNSLWSRSDHVSRPSCAARSTAVC